MKTENLQTGLNLHRSRRDVGAREEDLAVFNVIEGWRLEYCDNVIPEGEEG